ncbi:hypothetical protein BDW67DRAFT_164349 [Aspergillus spinulosporus]
MAPNQQGRTPVFESRCGFGETGRRLDTDRSRQRPMEFQSGKGNSRQHLYSWGLKAGERWQVRLL